MDIVYIIVIAVFWFLLGMTTLVPYMTPDEIGAQRPAKQFFTLILFITLGPIIAISTVIHLMLFYYFGGDPNNLQ
jgi:hypothetical protein